VFPSCLDATAPVSQGKQHWSLTTILQHIVHWVTLSHRLHYTALQYATPFLIALYINYYSCYIAFATQRAPLQTLQQLLHGSSFHSATTT
jgi:hypothetical protein